MTPAHPDTDEQLAVCRARIDAIDAQLIGLVAERRSVSAQAQQLRMSAGGPRIQHAREREIITRYREGLGAEGSRLGLMVLELCRGRS